MADDEQAYLPLLKPRKNLLMQKLLQMVAVYNPDYKKLQMQKISTGQFN